jgi:hypothetical protein
MNMNTAEIMMCICLVCVAGAMSFMALITYYEEDDDE